MTEPCNNVRLVPSKIAQTGTVCDLSAHQILRKALYPSTMSFNFENKMLVVVINILYILYLKLLTFLDEVAQLHAEEADRGTQVSGENQHKPREAATNLVRIRPLGLRTRTQ